MHSEFSSVRRTITEPPLPPAAPIVIETRKIFATDIKQLVVYNATRHDSIHEWIYREFIALAKFLPPTFPSRLIVCRDNDFLRHAGYAIRCNSKANLAEIEICMCNVLTLPDNDDDAVSLLWRIKYMQMRFVTAAVNALSLLLAFVWMQ